MEASKKNLIAADKPAVPPGPPVLPSSTASKAPSEITQQTLPEIWSHLLAQQGGFLRSDLEKAGLPAILAPNVLELRFPKEYNAARDRCLDPEKVGRIEEQLRQITGHKCQVRIESTREPTGNDAALREAEVSRVQVASASVPRSPEPSLVTLARDLLSQPIKSDPGFGASAVSGVSSEPSDSEEP